MHDTMPNAPKARLALSMGVLSEEVLGSVVTCPMRLSKFDEVGGCTISSCQCGSHNTEMTGSPQPSLPWQLESIIVLSVTLLGSDCGRPLDPPGANTDIMSASWWFSSPTRHENHQPCVGARSSVGVATQSSPLWLDCSVGSNGSAAVSMRYGRKHGNIRENSTSAIRVFFNIMDRSIATSGRRTYAQRLVSEQVEACFMWIPRALLADHGLQGSWRAIFTHFRPVILYQRNQCNISTDRRPPTWRNKHRTTFLGPI